jgi:hypothetical protein
MRLKACWTVQAGIIPCEPLPQFTKRWEYTSQEHQDDQHPGVKADPAYHTEFARMRAEAIDYYVQVSLPHLNNWAQITFVWY